MKSETKEQTKTYEASHLDIMNILFKMRERGDITDKQYNESEQRFKEIIDKNDK